MVCCRARRSALVMAPVTHLLVSCNVIQPKIKVVLARTPHTHATSVYQYLLPTPVATALPNNCTAAYCAGALIRCSK